MNIAVVGIGYVGLANAILLAQHNDVTALDIDRIRVEQLNQRKSPVDDGDASIYLSQKKLSLHATIDPEVALRHAEIIIIAVPTDYDQLHKCLDTTIVESVITVALQINPNATLVIKSTVPVGFTMKMAQLHRNDRIYYSPEFLREGKALHDNLFPARIIIGLDSALLSYAHDYVTQWQQGAIKQSIPVLFMSSMEAEASKLLANSYLAMRVAFFNELDTFAETHSIDSEKIITALGHDPRIGAYYQNPSFGYGGYCLPKDIQQMLISFAPSNSKLLPAVIESNWARKCFIVRQILNKAGSLQISTPTIGIYRLVIKSGSENFRHSAILDILEYIRLFDIDLLIYEPLLQENQFQSIPVAKSLASFLKESDLIVANRYHEELNGFEYKVYTRDLFHCD